jgi:hypothetical protein
METTLLRAGSNTRSNFGVRPWHQTDFSGVYSYTQRVPAVPDQDSVSEPPGAATTWGHFWRVDRARLGPLIPPSPISSRFRALPAGFIAPCLPTKAPRP